MPVSPSNSVSPMSYFIAVLLGLLLISVTYYLSDSYYFSHQSEMLDRQQERLTKLQRQNIENEKLKANANQLETALIESEHRYQALQSLIPSAAELPQILDWVAARAYERNLKLEHFSQNVAPPTSADLTPVPIQIEVWGYYDGVVRFIGDFSRFERVLRVDGVQMLKEQPINRTELPENQPLTVRATIHFSAYVSKGKL
jgi:Tfp pilus assembly protein PilO